MFYIIEPDDYEIVYEPDDVVEVVEEEYVFSVEEIGEIYEAIYDTIRYEE